MEHQFLHLIIAQLFQQPKCVLTPMSILCVLGSYDNNDNKCNIEHRIVAFKPIMLSVLMLNVIMLSFFMLNVIMLSFVMLNVVMLSFVMLNSECLNSEK